MLLAASALDRLAAFDFEWTLDRRGIDEQHLQTLDDFGRRGLLISPAEML